MVAAYVWDYAGEMRMLRVFWDAAVELNPAAAEFDQGRRFPICQPDALAACFSACGLAEALLRYPQGPEDSIGGTTRRGA